MRSRRIRSLFVPSILFTAALVLGLAPAGPAVAARAEKSEARAREAPAPTYDESLFEGLRYRLVGPFRGGRSTAVAGVPSRPDTFYMGTTGGGVWKTTDAGKTWVNVSDHDRDPDAALPRPMGEGPPPAEGQEGAAPARPAAERQDDDEDHGDRFGSASVGAIAVADSDPNVVYVGMGSACIRGNVSAGDGVYKSTDAGRSWRHVGLPEAGQIGAVVVHPTDPDTVWVAALGHAFGPNPERGVYRSRDGGASWQRVLYVSDEAGAVDLALDPSNPRVLYAATWQAVRQPWTMVSGGPGSGLWKSADGGDTWVELTEGLPEGIKGKISVTVSPARPDRVWALVEHKEKPGLYRSDNGGEKFRLVSGDRNLITRAWYYTHVHAHPTDPETVYVNNVLFWRSDDGGKSFTPIRTPHGDNHDLWIHPTRPEIMVQANDGGANVTNNGGRTWSPQDNQPTAEMYRAWVDDQHPYWIYGGQQDNSAVAIPSRAVGGNRIGRTDWYVPGGCESAHVAVDPRNPDVTWAGCYGGSIERYDRKLAVGEEVMAYPQLAVGQRPKDLKYRYQWNAPIRISPHDPDVLYHASNHVHRSRDGGQSWELASPDLTRDDESKQDYAGGPITWDNTGVEVYGTVFAFEESPHEAGVLWAGSDDGLVHVSRDDGATWQNVTPPGMPEWGTVNSIELSAHGPGRAFLAVHRYRLDDFAPYIFRTDDHGATWTRLTDGRNGIPARHFVRVVREDPERKGLLYAGTEFGMYVSFDDGATWQPFQLNLPVTPITDLAVKRGDLVVATQGRSYWILDDLTPLHQLSAEVAAAPVHLFEPRRAYQYPGGGFFGGGGGGENPPRGVMIFYSLGEDLSEEGAQEVKLEILDGAGEVLRSLSSQKPERSAPNPFARYFPEFFEPRKLPAEEGLNRWVWDFDLADAEVVEDAVLWGSAGGPQVPPGTYQARLTLGDTVRTVSFEVAADPRQDVPREDREARYELARKVWRDLSRSHQALKTVRDLRQQVEAVAGRVDPEKEDEDLQAKAKAVTEALTAVEEELTQPKSKASQDILNFPPQLDNHLMHLLSVVESSRGRPTEGSYQRYDDLEAELEDLLTRLDGVIATELAAFNQAVQGRETPPVVVGKTGWRE